MAAVNPVQPEPHWIDLTESTDTGFAERSASYLSALGVEPGEIRRVLIDELQVSAETADSIVAIVCKRPEHAG